MYPHVLHNIVILCEFQNLLLMRLPKFFNLPRNNLFKVRFCMIDYIDCEQGMYEFSFEI